MVFCCVDFWSLEVLGFVDLLKFRGVDFLGGGAFGGDWLIRVEKGGGAGDGGAGGAGTIGFRVTISLQGGKENIKKKKSKRSAREQRDAESGRAGGDRKYRKKRKKRKENKKAGSSKRRREILNGFERNLKDCERLSKEFEGFSREFKRFRPVFNGI